MRSVHTDEYRAILAVMIDARKRAGVTQQRLARRLKRPQSFVSKYETGERRVDVAEFFVILRALGADPRSIVDQILATSSFRRQARRASHV